MIFSFATYPNICHECFPSFFWTGHFLFSVSIFSASKSFLVVFFNVTITLAASEDSVNFVWSFSNKSFLFFGGNNWTLRSTHFCHNLYTTTHPEAQRPRNPDCLSLIVSCRSWSRFRHWIWNECALQMCRLSLFSFISFCYSLNV